MINQLPSLESTKMGLQNQRRSLIPLMLPTLQKFSKGPLYDHCSIVGNLQKTEIGPLENVIRIERKMKKKDCFLTKDLLAS